MLLDELERELRAERPEPEPDFARRLDEWAAAGFPRRDGLDPRRPQPRLPGWPHRIHERLSAVPPQRLLAPAGAALTLVVVVAVAISQGGAPDTGGEEGGPLQPAPSPQREAEAVSPAPPAAAETLGGAAAELDRAGAGAAREVGPRGRRIAQRIDLALVTSPDGFRDAADGVFDVVRDHRGFVVLSSVSGGDPDVVDGAQPGTASFRLRIPAVELQPALAALSELGHVVSRTDGTMDITARFTSAQRRIEELTRERSRLLEQLEDADAEAERRGIQAQLRIVNAELADAEEALARAQNRVRMVPVGVSIAADSALEDDGADGGWSLDEAADDAVDVLRFAAGVALVSAAVLVPIAALAALAWLVATRARTRARERALDG
jgi:hypothetical protein